MTVKIKEESGRIYRYVIVKCISKGEYVLVTVATYLNYGSTYAPYAFAVSFIFANILDFIGQKYWVFKNKKELTMKMLRDVVLYSLVRGLNFFLVLLVYSVLTEYLHTSKLVAGLIILLIFVPLGFLLYRWLFIGKVRDLWDVLKKG